MKVIFKTSLDHYSSYVCFPINLEIPPRIGETVNIVDSLRTHFQQQRLPTRMEVVDVIWTEHAVICELWYKKQDVEAAKFSGVKLL